MISELDSRTSYQAITRFLHTLSQLVMKYLLILTLGCGRMTAMWAAHPFALYFAVLALLILVVSFLGAGRRHLVADGILALERRTHAHAILLSSFVIFGIQRLVILGLKH